MTKSNDKMKEEKTKSKVQEYAEAIIIAILIALFIRTFIIAAYKIPSRSMEPTLLVGDHLLVNKFIYGVKIPFFRKTIFPVTDPGRADVIVFIFPHDSSNDFIKLFIVFPCDTI